MRGSLRGIRIDRERALKVGAMAGLAVVGISTLPGLLKTPEPPPVPADVGFRPAEMARYAASPTPEELAGRRAETRKKRLAERKQRRRERVVARKRQRGRDAAREKRKTRKKLSGRKEGAAPPSPPGSAPAYSPPAYAPPASASPPAPESTLSAPASPPPPPLPADGSEEFAPR